MCKCVGHPFDCHDHPRDCGCTRRQREIDASPERFLDFLKFSTLKPLQEQAAQLGICPNCHKKTLTHRVTNELGRCMQCTGCTNIYVLPALQPRSDTP